MNNAIEKINEAVSRKFIEEKLNEDEFSKDITSFNSTATKAIIILDNCDSIDRVFILVGLHATVDKSWKVTYFKNSSYERIRKK